MLRFAAMTLRDWMRKVGRDVAQDVASRAGTTILYFEQLAGGHSRAGLKLTKRIVFETQRATPDEFVTPSDLRPDAYPAGFMFPPQQDGDIDTPIATGQAAA
jgi:hypothetical protein